MIPRAFARIDLMIRLLVLAVLLASFLPVRGQGQAIAQIVSNAAIFLLFLLNGLRLDRAEVVRGLRHFRFLVPLVLWCFGAMALAGWGVSKTLDGHLPPLVMLGFIYLGSLPSTVQSATAYASIAGGNVARSVVAAALLNILGVFLTVPIFSLLARSGEAVMTAIGLAKVFAVLILPFTLGQLLQARGGDWVRANPAMVAWMDRLAVAIAVYVAFSGAVVQGIWSRVGVTEWAMLLSGVAGMLVFAFIGSWMLGGAVRLARAERISFLFAGAQKSTAMGAPLATVLFEPDVAGIVLLPLLTYHLAQLVISAPLSTRMSRHSDHVAELA